jgi:FMN reductase
LVQVLLRPSDYSLLPEQLFKKELIMSRPLKVVALSGGTWRPSRTLVLTQALLAELAEQLYATEADFTDYQITSEPLKARIRLAAERAAPLFGVHPKNLLKIA